MRVENDSLVRRRQEAREWVYLRHGRRYCTSPRTETKLSPRYNLFVELCIRLRFPRAGEGIRALPGAHRQDAATLSKEYQPAYQSTYVHICYRRSRESNGRPMLCPSSATYKKQRGFLGALNIEFTSLSRSAHPWVDRLRTESDTDSRHQTADGTPRTRIFANQTMYVRNRRRQHAWHRESAIHICTRYQTQLGQSILLV